MCLTRGQLWERTACLCLLEYPLLGSLVLSSSLLASNRSRQVISLGIGDTTHPLPEPIVKAMADYVNGLGTKEGYEGYDPKSEAALKEGIAKVMYPGLNISAG